MKSIKKRFNYAGLKMSGRFINIVCLAIFIAVFANIVNLGSFYRGSIEDLNAGLLKLKAYGITSGILSEKVFKSETSKNVETDLENDAYAIVSSGFSKMNPTLELSKKRIYFSPGGMKFFQTVPFYDMKAEKYLPFLSAGNNFVMTLILALLLTALLPRGVPETIKNQKIYLKPILV